MPRRRIGLPQRDNAPAAPVDIPKSLQKKAKPVKDMDTVIAQAKAMAEKYAGKYDCVTDKDVLIDYVDTRTLKGRKEGYRIKGPWSAKFNPFIELYDEDDKIIKVFYSEVGNACNQLITYLNEHSV